ncbi:MAG: hypothetical protein IPK22_06685 [Verrucomicrobiaceae bacterium]|nr:hypothetical protein [Verrucomicrobiaceae bacterium]
MNEQLILMTKRLFREPGSRKRPGVRRSSGAVERLTAFGKLQRAGAVQNALALMLIASLIIAARPVQAQWEQLPPLPEPNGGFVATTVDGKIEVRGGTNWSGGEKNWLKFVRQYSPASQKWSALPDLKSPLAYGISIGGKGHVLDFGGTDGSRPLRVFGAPSELVLACGGVRDFNQLVFAGGTNDPSNLLGLCRRTWSHNGKSGFKQLADYPGKPFGLAGSEMVGEELFVFGGMNYDKVNKAAVNTAEAYAFSPEKNVWRKLASLAAPTRGLTAVTLDDGHIYIAGGYRDDFTAEAVIYDVKADSYRKAIPLPYAAMVGLVKMGEHVYCLGGEDKKQSRTDKFFRIPVAELLK